MDTSSQEVIDAVAEKIQYYIDIKRREDGFDLSGPSEPKRRYPKLKNLSVLDNGRLHDRSLKHYFTPSMIRTQIANLEAMPPGTARQQAVNKELKNSLKNPKIKSSTLPSHLDLELYSAQMEALYALERNTRRRIKSKVSHSTPTLQTTAPAKISRAEMNRLINRSSQILVATETVALAHDIITRRHRTRPQSAPTFYGQTFPELVDLPQRPQTARGRRIGNSIKKRKPKYAWDINGRRVPYEDIARNSLDYATSSSCSLSSSSADYESHYRRRGKQAQLESYQHRPSPPRPTSARHASSIHPKDSAIYRPYSAGVIRPREFRHQHASSRPPMSPDSGFIVNAATQTRARPSDRRHRPLHVYVPGSDNSSEPEAATELRKYKVVVETGDRLGAGTAADVYLSFHGDQASTDEIFLTDSLMSNSNSANGKQKPFRRGQIATFEVETEDIGQLHKIGIGHDQKDKGSSWFLKQVTVSSGSHSWKIQCKLWLSGTFGVRKTFQYIAVDHEASEESTDSDSSEELTPTSGSSRLSERSDNRSRSASNASSKSEESDQNVTARAKQRSPMHSSATSSSDHDSDAAAGQGGDRAALARGDGGDATKVLAEAESHVEYSSDSSAIDATKPDGSYVETSEVTNSSTTSGSQSLDDSDSSVQSVVRVTPVSAGAPQSKEEDHAGVVKNGSSAEASSPPKESKIKRVNSVFGRFLNSGAAESSSEKSSSDDEAERSTTANQELTRQPSAAESVDVVDVESASILTEPGVDMFRAAMASIPEPNSEEAEEEPAAETDSSKSSSSDDSSNDTEAENEAEAVSAKLIETKEDSNREAVHDALATVREDKGNLSQEESASEKLSITPPITKKPSFEGNSSKSSTDEEETTNEPPTTSSPPPQTEEELQEESQAKADVYMEGFNAGVAIARKLSLTQPELVQKSPWQQQKNSYSSEVLDETESPNNVGSPRRRAGVVELHDLIKDGEPLSAIMEMIENNPELREKPNEQGWTPVHAAATHGKLEALQWLAATASDLNTETPTGYTAMHMASMHGHVQCLMVLHAMGGKLDAVNVDGQTALHLASMSGHIETVKWLVANRANLRARDSSLRVKLKHFKKFDDTTEALAATTAAVEGKLAKPLKKVLKKIIAKDAHERLAVADAKLGQAIKEKLNLPCIYSPAVQEVMRGIRAHVDSLITGLPSRDMTAMALGLAHSLSRYKLKFSPDKVDTMIVQAISLLDDLDKELNNYVMRCREWYGWHFPELGKLITDHLAFAKVIKKMGFRTNASATDLSDALPEETEEQVKELAEISMGTEISEEDIINITYLADQIMEITDYRAQLYDYLKNRMMAIAPNLTILIGELVGARLIAHAGSLLNLAKHPASTVQILGAEKALFRALKTRKDTPKYGLIYHASLVGQTNPKNKGKVSRMLAAKCALAIRYDALAEESSTEMGIDNRAKLEQRVKFMEEGGSKRFGSVLSRSAGKHDKWVNKSEVKMYDNALDSTIPAPKKRKMEDASASFVKLENGSDAEDTSLLVSDGTLQQPPKKKTKTDAVVKIERPAEGDESIVGLTKKKKEKKKKKQSLETDVSVHIAAETPKKSSTDATSQEDDSSTPATKKKKEKKKKRQQEADSSAVETTTPKKPKSDLEAAKQEEESTAQTETKKKKKKKKQSEDK